ncbi:MAG: aminodeoxychorismate synthase component I [Planctomycetes bacterium]|nr:aminodeoxychorismate synthase component I [Planctomycetota bacterium]
MNDTIEVSLVCEGFSERPSLAGLLKRLGLAGETVVLGDFSSDSCGGYSYLGWSPAELFTVGRDDAGCPLEKLERVLGRYRLSGDGELPVPFVGGWVGTFSYDLCGHIEKLPNTVNHDLPLPLIRLAFYDAVLCWDHSRHQGTLLALQYEGQKTSVEHRLTQLRDLYEGSLCEPVSETQTLGSQEWLSAAEVNINREDYLEKIAQIKEYIRDGEVYEVNLSQRFSMDYERDAEPLYTFLTRCNPAAYSGLIRTQDYSIVSVSPELFLSRRAERIETRPIKGTIARGKTEEEDREKFEQLVRSGKDIAELNMIIDLERNDFHRFCRTGSVEVIEARKIEPHPTLYHAVATIAGKLDKQVGLSEILRCTFPGGSVTGAPKIRACEIIDELEPTARSVYTGSLGWIGLNGDFDLNIAIRTIILSQGKAWFQTGGAIVDDSQVESEYEETLTKANALGQAILTCQRRSSPYEMARQ